MGRRTGVPRWLDRWLRFGLARDALVFLALLLCLLTGLALAYDRSLLGPRIDAVARIVAANLGGLAAAVRRLPEAQREPFVHEVQRLSGGAVQMDDPARWGLHEPDGYLQQRNVERVRELLPQDTIAYATTPSDAMWIAVPGAQGRRLWLRVALPVTTERLPLFAVGALGLLGLAAVLGGLVLLAQVRRLVFLGRPGSPRAPAAAGPRAQQLEQLQALYAQAPAAAREPLAQFAAAWEALVPGGGPAAETPAEPATAPAARPLGPPWQHLGFVMDVAMVLGLAAATLSVLLWAGDRLVLRPRFQDAGAYVASQLRGMRAVAAALPAPQQAGYLQDLKHLSGGRVRIDDPLRWPMGEPTYGLVGGLIERLRTDLPDVPIMVSPAPDAFLWVRLPPNVQQGAWLRIGSGPRPGRAWLTLLAVLPVLAACGAVLVVHGGRRRAARLWRALAGEDEGPLRAPLEGAAARLLAADPQLRQRRNALLAEREQHAQALRQALAQARAALAALRQLRPSGAAGVQALGCLDGMAQVLAVLDGGEGSADKVDLNELLAQLAAQARRPVMLLPTGLPYVRMRAADARQLLRAVFDELLADGGSIASSLEQGWVVLRLRPAQPGGAPPALERVGQLAKAQGGQLRELAQADGARQLELWLPVARP